MEIQKIQNLLRELKEDNTSGANEFIDKALEIIKLQLKLTRDSYKDIREEFIYLSKQIIDTRPSMAPLINTIGYLIHNLEIINGNIIEKANFITDGCGASFATASQTTLLIEGNILDFAEKLRPENIDKALHGLPEDHKHCAELAVRTLNRAIKKYKDKI